MAVHVELEGIPLNPLIYTVSSFVTEFTVKVRVILFCSPTVELVHLEVLLVVFIDCKE
jgi:hypothetical protein